MNILICKANKYKYDFQQYEAIRSGKMLVKLSCTYKEPLFW